MDGNSSNVAIKESKKLSMCKSSRNRLEKIAPNHFRVNICPKTIQGNASQNFPTVEKNNLTNFIMWTAEAVYTDYHLPVTSEQHITISAC